MQHSIVALDSGSSTMKALTAKSRDLFPSVARVVDGSDYPDTIVLDGQRWVVGETALRTYAGDARLRPQIQRGFHGSQHQRAQMCHTFGRLGVEGEHDVLVVSLPYGDTRQGDAVARVKQMNAFAWTDGRGRKHEVSFKRVWVMPQGVGALSRYKAAYRARPSPMCMVDVGSCTVDQVMLHHSAEQEDYLYLHDRSMSRRDLNVTAFYEHWLGLIRRLEGMQDAQQGYYQLMDVAISGNFKLRWGRDTVDVAATYNNARAWFTQQLVQLVTQEMGAFERDVERILLTGGGAHLVDLDTWDDPRVERLSQWANVEGQYLEACGSTDIAAMDAIRLVREVAA